MAPERGYDHDDAFGTGELQVSDLHRVHYSQYGKPDGKPVIFLHGGPGGDGTVKTNTVFFDPSIYHVVLLDQRGAGQSQPSAETRENTTQLLVEDIETLRKHVGVKKWHMVFGGSWGSTLALAYSQAHPEACGSLVLRGIFFGSKKELAYVLDGQLTGIMNPEEYERFINYLPEDKRSDPLMAYHELIMSDDREVAFRAAQEWNRLELSISFLHGYAAAFDKFEDERWVMNHAKLEVHFFAHASFLPEGQLLKDCDKIKHIPTSIIQGRNDMICPPKAAWDLHNHLPQSKLYWSPSAGHSAMEPENFKKLLEVCDEYGKEDFHLQ